MSSQEVHGAPDGDGPGHRPESGSRGAETQARPVQGACPRNLTAILVLLWSDPGLWNPVFGEV